MTLHGRIWELFASDSEVFIYSSKLSPAKNPLYSRPTFRPPFSCSFINLYVGFGFHMKFYARFRFFYVLYLVTQSVGKNMAEESALLYRSLTPALPTEQVIGANNQTEKAERNRLLFFLFLWHFFVWSLNSWGRWAEALSSLTPRRRGGFFHLGIYGIRPGSGKSISQNHHDIEFVLLYLHIPPPKRSPVLQSWFSSCTRDTWSKKNY